MIRWRTFIKMMGWEFWFVILVCIVFMGFLVWEIVGELYG